MTLRQGSYRFVIVTRRRAYKIPRFRYWGTFLAGLLMNVGETLRWRMSTERSRLCPVLFALPGGWLVVMPACTPVRVAELDAAERAYFSDVLGIEVRDENLGRMADGRVVAVDYPRQSDIVCDADGEADLQRPAAAVDDVCRGQLQTQHGGT